MSQDVLYFSQKKLQFPDAPQDIQFPLTVDVAINIQSRIVAVHDQGMLKANVRLSPNEFLALHIFYEQYPYYAPDFQFFEVFGEGATKRVIVKLRAKLRILGYVDIKRMREAGYFLVDVRPPTALIQNTLPEPILVQPLTFERRNEISSLERKNVIKNGDDYPIENI